MKKMIRKIKQYLPFARAGMQSMLIYKAQIFMWLFISFFEIFFLVFLYQALYRNHPDGMSANINGFTFYEMILYMVTSFVFTFLVSSSETNWNIFTDIKEGTIANTLTKPVSYRLRHLFTCLGGMILGFVLIVLPILTVVYAVFILVFDIYIKNFIINILLFLLYSIIGCLINDAISYFIGLLTFFTEHMFGLNMFRTAIQSFLSGTLLPLSYMGAFGVICSYTPFAFINYNPVLTLMGKIELRDALMYLGIGVLWVIGIEYINKVFFKYCVKRVSVQGG